MHARILPSVLVIALAVSAVGYAGTRVVWDTAVVIQNHVTVGVVDLSIDELQAEGRLIDGEQLTPGEARTGSVTLRRAVSSTANGVTFRVSMGTDVETLVPAQGQEQSIPLEQALLVRNLSYGGLEYAGSLPDSDGDGSAGTIADLARAPFDGLPDPGEAGKVLLVTIELDGSRASLVMGQVVSVDFEFVLHQGAVV